MGIHIGNNNKIKNSNFIENSNVETKENGGFWRSVLVNLTSNALWWVIGVVAIVVVVYVLKIH